MSVTPMLKFAFTQQLSVAGGVGITELDPLIEELREPSQMANVAIGSVRYRQSWGREQHLGGAITLRAGTGSLQSDFRYDRYLGEADYSVRRGDHRLIVSGMAGRIDGRAPLFERFSLGDSRTLRGWDKYDIAPAGGDRMFHTSVEYRIHEVQLFVDAGSVWDAGFERRVRFSTGAGFTPGPLFFTLGFPLNTDEFRAVFTMGFRWGRTTVGITKQ
jgi:outer membrane translocation and assembly module TamA